MLSKLEGIWIDHELNLVRTFGMILKEKAKSPYIKFNLKLGTNIVKDMITNIELLAFIYLTTSKVSKFVF